MKKVYILYFSLAVLLLMCFAPWLSKEKALTLAFSKIDFVRSQDRNSVAIKKVPFGFIVKGDVSACPICPAFSKRAYFVSPFFTVTRIK